MGVRVAVDIVCMQLCMLFVGVDDKVTSCHHYG